MSLLTDILDSRRRHSLHDRRDTPVLIDLIRCVNALTPRVQFASSVVWANLTALPVVVDTGDGSIQSIVATIRVGPDGNAIWSISGEARQAEIDFWSTAHDHDVTTEGVSRSLVAATLDDFCAALDAADFPPIVQFA